jgi:hypothetical protein
MVVAFSEVVVVMMERSDNFRVSEEDRWTDHAEY